MKIQTLVIVTAAALLLGACGKQEEAAAPAVAEQVQPAPAPVPEVAAAPVNEAGEKIYKGTCSMCHASGTAGAPILGNKEDWAPRIAQGADTLYKHAIEGFTGAKGMMPAKGGMASMSDDDAKAAVDYMVAKSQ